MENELPTTITLSERDLVYLLASYEAEQEPNEALKQLAKEYKEKYPDKTEEKA